MNIRVRDWLPDDVIAHEVVREAVEQAIAQWSARWFVGPYAGVASIILASGDLRQENDEMGWRRYRSGIAVRGSRQALSRLVERALDVSAEISTVTQADRHVLQALERTILEGLTEEIEQAFDLPGALRQEPLRIRDPLADDGGLVICLSEPSGREGLSLAVPVDIAVRKIKSHLGPAPRRSEVLQPLAAALGGVSLGLEARVGRVELSLSELTELAVGDVLVLDRALDQAVDVVGATSHDVVAKAMLTQADDGIALVFNA